MKFSALILLVTLCGGCAQKPDTALIDPAKIEASLDMRRAWVREQKKLDRERFDLNYGFVLSAPRIESKEAMQIGYLFFYSAGNLCGYLDNPRLIDGVWRLEFFPGLPPSSGNPVFVDVKSGKVWQDESKKIDAFALIRYE